MPAKLIHSAPAARTDPDPANESAEYIAVLAGRLQRIAETNSHDFLAYLIEMVVLEAWRIAGPEANRSDNKFNSADGSRV